jgi:hypothetical protein
MCGAEGWVATPFRRRWPAWRAGLLADGFVTIADCLGNFFRRRQPIQRMILWLRIYYA